ncbi:MAG: M60 family metallopeptidase [Bacteroides sp]|nr:M60 family metallopeptidase [Bacteroides sp.]
MKHLNFFFYFILVVFLSACSSGSEDIPNPSPIPEPTGEYIPKTLGSSAIGYDPLTLFTDQTCSALKTGITDEDIKACKSDFHKNIALYLKAGKYPSEFRIQEYKAYPHPDTQAKANKTSPYSLLDNPTGMAIGNGEELVIFVGETAGQKIQIRIQDLAVPGDDGFGGISYTLNEGVNQIHAPKKGLIYILYHTEDFETARPIKIHIASGHVNGYFDVTKHSGSDWKRLRDAAKEPFFDVIGKYAHLTFPTKDFILYTPDGKALIEAYDKIVESEMLLMGLFKYNKVFKNRMYFNVTYRGYMYATSYHTAYHESTMPDLCDVSKLTDKSLWGPCHEVGHCNQTRPGLKWHGTTEVTNNIMSMYLQNSIFKRDSHLQTTKLNDGSPNRYAKAWTEIIAANAPHCDFKSNDVFCKLVPFWQLELYFGNVLGQTPLQQDDKGGFYPDVYEYVRTHPDLNTAGEQQTEFVYICSQVAQMDLTDFFTKWGFLTPVETTIDDYGNGQVKVTQARVEEIKQRVASLNYPQPNVALEYITDNNWKLYQNPQPVIEGQAMRSGNTLKMTDWKNVVAYEVTNKEGKKIFISEGILFPDATASFTINTDWEEGFKVYAVSASGERTEVKL